jgi:SagB-type dehydrogenase family enzyme
MKLSDEKSNAAGIFRYHEETKHHYNRYARSAGYMDWANQPNPFRFYEDTLSFNLPFLKEDPPARHADLYRRGRNTSREFRLENIAGLLELSLGLSAWKAAGNSKWSLRMNPSSGNLHPTEAYLILPPVQELTGGVYHYNSLRHALELRAELAEGLWKDITSHFGCPGFMIGLSSIFWRESWKYGERAFRYCNHDVGHALAAVSVAANLLGWKATYLNGLSDSELETLLGFDKTRFETLEGEHPDLLCWVHPCTVSDVPRILSKTIISYAKDAVFKGRPNQLSRQAIDWEIIYSTAELSRKLTGAEQRYDFTTPYDFQGGTPDVAATRIIRQRRSATAFDRNGSITRDQFLAILNNTLPRHNHAPFDVGLQNPTIHLLLFVHNVADLAPGLYFFIRDKEITEPIKRLSRTEFLWEPLLDDFPLYLLEEGDFRQQAMMVSCHQDIAGHSAFSLGMIAAFKEPITARPSAYRQLFWESGMIGQILYLDAEAHGVRGTGIGCYFDDAVHEVLGLTDNQYQSLYHFTIGKPIEDHRLTTLPPYHHLKDR